MQPWMRQAVLELVGQYAEQPLQQTGMLSKAQLTKFFVASGHLLDTADVKQELKAAADQHQEAEDVITDLQKELFKAQGINGGWGIECLGQVGDTYQDDTDFMKLFVTAVEREEEAVNEAELSPEDFLDKKQRMKAMREQNDALVAQMEGMSHEEQKQFLKQQVTDTLNQLPAEEREAALENLVGHHLQCGEHCGHVHDLAPALNGKHEHGPGCSPQHTQTAHAATGPTKTASE
ncbi:hypothetical protein ABBQ32_004909 [Trebouxia sp. C0010 RCD-2024]